MKLKVASNYRKTEKERSMNENIQEDYDEYGDAVENSFSEYFRDKLERTPWWMISIVFHVTLAFLATLVVYSKATPESEPEFEYVTEIQPVKREQVKPERKKDVFETNPVKFDEPIIENPTVNKVDVSDHHETESLEDHQMAKGLEALQNSPVKQNFDNSSIGISGVPGGVFGTRFDGKANLVWQGGGSQVTEDAVQAGLEWLKRHQSADGSWNTDGYHSHCGFDTSFSGSCDGDGHDEYDVAMTALSVMCFLGAGHTPTVGDYKEQVKKAIKYLMNSQDKEGCVGNRELPRHMYNHATATMALAEAYALSNHKPLLKIATKKAIEFLLKAQTNGGGWRYTFRAGDDDTSVMGWCIMALRAARLAGLEIPESSFDGARNFLSTVTSSSYRVGYRHRNGQIEFESSVMTTQPVFRLGELFRQGLQGNVVSPALQKAFAENEHSLSNYTTLERKNFRGISSALGSSVASNESSSWLLTDTQNKKQYIIDGSQLMVSLVPAVFAASEAMTAVSMTARIFMKSSRKEPHFEGGADLLRQYLPAWKERDANNQSVINYYYWYYGTLAMFQMGGDYWSDWNEKMKDVLVNHQEKEGCKTGSWPAIGKRCGAGGRIYATTLSILSLEIYYRYQKILNE